MGIRLHLTYLTPPELTDPGPRQTLGATKE